ncbi:MAG: peptide ABC transporter permease [Rhodopirellula sp.]|nr:peptide ABC transporter permease [Rhodopirellula sp.]OUX52769.1 MAG: peptide ABC transporter permease [Rhodopirellula sp. TMED283]
MSLIHIAWRNFCHRALSSFLTTFSLALGVGLVVLVLSIYGVISEAFTRNASVGYNLVVGPKGSPLQLTLNSVFYLSQPIENLPYTEYMEFLPQDERASMVSRFGGDPKLAERDGRYAPYIAGGFAIPLALGDYFGEFRVVGTTPDFFTKLKHGPNVDEDFTFSQGRAFSNFSRESSYFEAVLGARVAKEMNVVLGEKFYPTHGDPSGQGHEQGFTIVGILDPTGTPNDRAAFVNLEGFYLMEGHAKPIERDPEENGEDLLDEAVNAEESNEEQSDTDAQNDSPTADAIATGSKSNGVPLVQNEAENSGSVADSTPDTIESQSSVEEHRVLSIPEREVTSILIRNGNIMFAPGMQNAINEGIRAQAAAPIGEINKLMNLVVGPLLTALLAITGITCAVAAVGILVSIYNSMNDRRRDIAIMRALGARRTTVTSIIIFESFQVALIGTIAGWLLAHTAIVLYSGKIEDQTGVQVGFFTTSNYEILVLPLVLGLALIAALLPAWAAYRTDVGSNLSA